MFAWKPRCSSDKKWWKVGNLFVKNCGPFLVSDNLFHGGHFLLEKFTKKSNFTHDVCKINLNQFVKL